MEKKSYKIVLSAVVLAVVLVDQVTKSFVVRFVPIYSRTFHLGNFFSLIHVRNKAVAFSLGSSLPGNLKKGLFIVIPLAFLIYLFVQIWRRKIQTTLLSLTALSLIIGGGTGNLIDRIFRPLGVVDFLDFNFYGILGLQRWPTFNVADSCVVVGALLYFVSIILEKQHTREAPKT